MLDIQGNTMIKCNHSQVIKKVSYAMNAEKAQTIINQIVEDYRTTAYAGGRKQYPASKKYIARATELGILDLIPNAPYSQHIGNDEIQLILKAAEDASSQVGGMVDGEGDAVSADASELYKALNEVEPDSTNGEIQVGSQVRVINHTRYSDLVVNATVTPMIEHPRQGYETTIRTIWQDDFEDEYGNPTVVYSYEVETGEIFSREQIELL